MSENGTEPAVSEEMEEERENQMTAVHVAVEACSNVQYLVDLARNVHNKEVLAEDGSPEEAERRLVAVSTASQILNVFRHEIYATILDISFEEIEEMEDKEMVLLISWEEWDGQVPPHQWLTREEADEWIREKEKAKFRVVEGGDE